MAKCIVANILKNKEAINGADVVMGVKNGTEVTYISERNRRIDSIQKFTLKFL